MHIFPISDAQTKFWAWARPRPNFQPHEGPTKPPPNSYQKPTKNLPKTYQKLTKSPPKAHHKPTKSLPKVHQKPPQSPHNFDQKPAEANQKHIKRPPLGPRKAHKKRFTSPPIITDWCENIHLMYGLGRGGEKNSHVLSVSVYSFLKDTFRIVINKHWLKNRKLV